MKMRLLVLATLVFAIATAPLAEGAPDAGGKAPVQIQLLSISDWHAQLDPINGVGGAAVLSSYFTADRLANPNSLTLTAGDAYGASPPLASFFGEEPAVRAMNLMGFDADTLGNHNFDKGTSALQSLIDLASFDYLSANLKNVEDNLDDVAPFAIYERGGVKIGVVGITNPEAPTLVFPGSFGTIEVTDPVSAANQAKARAKAAGAEILIAITHLGITGTDALTGEPTGPLVDFAENVGGFDVILGDHTDVQYSRVINNALVVENRSKGQTYAKTTLTVDPRNGRVIDREVRFVVPTAAAVTPDPAIVSMLQPYRDQLAPIFNVRLGASTTAVPRTDSCGNSNGRICESKVGDIVADAMRTTYGTDFAITNSGGLRAALTCPTTDNPTDFCPATLYPFAAGVFPITRGQVLGVLPFGNIAVTLSVNGAELKAILENGVSLMPSVQGRFNQVSGLCFTYDINAPAGSRVTLVVRQATDGSCTGSPVDLTASSTYSLAENDFMVSGAEGHPNFAGRSTSRDILDQVVADYIAARGTLAPSIQGRIVCTGTGCPTVTP